MLEEIANIFTDMDEQLTIPSQGGTPSTLLTSRANASSLRV